MWFECSYVSLAWMRLCFITCYYDPKYFVLGMCSTAKFPKKDYLICRMREIYVEVGSFGNCKPLTNHIIISYNTSQEFWTRFVLCCVWFCEFCYQSTLFVSFRVTWLPLGQLYSCRSANERALKGVGEKIKGAQLTIIETKAKQNAIKTVCLYNG